ncbi:hypothetical protein QBC35DRAFT_174035 [Podospora australis]|uniref:GAT domain-containing protein n=1 Tax=Podospora australis TaxID=1536484 RepID=A0AAN7AKL7_9PEZI|nr:hypothetical protein QBC35DRAFT_174035 [Podospora australis]
MKGFSMNKVLGTIKKRHTSNSDGAVVDPATESPEETAARCVKQFCESRGSASGDDVIFLPSIVEAAVASPAAATEAARLIRKFLGRDYWSRPSCQYNSIMLIRILCDNPGPSFTRNIDKKFADTCKELLRSGRDVSVRQMLMETLDSFENTKGYDEGLALIVEMWKKEKEKAYKAYGGSSSSAPRGVVVPSFHPGHQQQPGYYHHHQQQQQQQQPVYPQQPHASRRQLPDPVELANRLEEARTSAKLLEQVVACTPPSEVLSNELIKEFSDRCTGASRSIQGYMSAENPGPDNDTMESLIDTNEQLQQALNHHRRAVLQAKKHLGLGQGGPEGGHERSSLTPSPGGAPPGHPPATQQYNQGVPPAAARTQMGSGRGGNGFGVPGGAGFGGAGSSSASSSNDKGKASASGAGLGGQYSSSAYVPAAAGPSRSATVTPHRDSSEAEDPFRDPPTQHDRFTTSDGRSRGRDSTSDETPRLPYEPYHPGFMGSSAFSSDGGHQQKKKAGELEPVTPVSDDDDTTDRRYRPAATAPSLSATDDRPEPPVKDPGPLYRY